MCTQYCEGTKEVSLTRDGQGCDSAQVPSKTETKVKASLLTLKSPTQRSRIGVREEVGEQQMQRWEGTLPIWAQLHDERGRLFLFTHHRDRQTQYKLHVLRIIHGVEEERIIFPVTSCCPLSPTGKHLLTPGLCRLACLGQNLQGSSQPLFVSWHSADNSSNYSGNQELQRHGAMTVGLAHALAQTF